MYVSFSVAYLIMHHELPKKATQTIFRLNSTPKVLSVRPSKYMVAAAKKAFKIISNFSVSTLIKNPIALTHKNPIVLWNK